MIIKYLNLYFIENLVIVILCVYPERKNKPIDNFLKLRYNKQNEEKEEYIRFF